MTTLAAVLRRQLENAVRKARSIADDAAADTVGRLGIAAAFAPAHLSEAQKALRRRLRAHGRSLGDKREPGGAMTTRHLAEAAAYEHWHRMLFGRFLVERNLLIHPKHGVPISRGELKELAEEEGFADEWALVERFAAPNLPGIFKPDDPVLALELDPYFQARLRALVSGLPEEIFAADDSLGWTYQFWQADEKKRVNDRQGKIGADELPAVTQLFTEPYMVKFLLHNTLGAWWAGKVLAGRPDLSRVAPDEAALREACALPGLDWEYLRFVREENGNCPWRPAAGTFPGWPRRAAEITYLDPCCGSGHFLVEAFAILAALRQAEEGLLPAEAARAVLRDNLHGLEIDGRCVQIAAFSVALAAWRLAGAQIRLPVPHIAWVGAPPPLPKSDFCALGNGDPELQRGLAALHDLFTEAPLLGSLIELTGGDLVDSIRIARLDESIAALVEKMRGAEPERAEGAFAARGMADAAAILARRFTLQATNVPFLGLRRQEASLASYVRSRFESAKADLATAMMLRMFTSAQSGGTITAVTPQNWLFLGSYMKMRRQLLQAAQLKMNVALGPAAFHDMNWWGIQTALLAWTADEPDADSTFFALDADTARDLDRKPALMRSKPARTLSQATQGRNPDSRITTHDAPGGFLLSEYADCFAGILNGDSARFQRNFWEITCPAEEWSLQQTTVESTTLYDGMNLVIYFDSKNGHLREEAWIRRERLHNSDQRGNRAWGSFGIAVGQMRSLPASLYTGEKFDSNIAVIRPSSEDYLLPIYLFCSSDGYEREVRKIDQKVNVTNATLVKVPFDLAHWKGVAAEKYPNGLPEPYSDDPTQWLFHGHPRYAEVGTELHVALARLAGYRWPAESDTEMRLSTEARTRIADAENLPEADAGGLLALVPVLGERPLADRLRVSCAAAWGDSWAPGSEAALISAACERAKDKPPKQLTFDSWLRTHAARQHAKLFHDRPFLWWVTDGRADGFTVVAHYHRLDHGNLERLAYTLLNDWTNRQGDDPRAEAARILQQKLARILEGEAPYDIFVRWKPLARQPLGWDPDLDDGVRLNIRPFVEAGVLAHVPNVKYGVDRGKDVPSAPWYHLFEGERRNDFHTTLAEKRAARAEAAE